MTPYEIREAARFEARTAMIRGAAWRAVERHVLASPGTPLLRGVRGRPGVDAVAVGRIRVAAASMTAVVEQGDENAVPNCNHPEGTTLGHDVSPTPMWAVRRGIDKVWYCPDCNRSTPRDES